jgi:aspartate kinase
VDLRLLGDVSMERNRGIIAIVGAGICDAGGAMGRALMALGDVQIHMMSLSATGINLTVIVDADAVNPAMRRLHSEFFGGDAQ